MAETIRLPRKSGAAWWLMAIVGTTTAALGLWSFAERPGAWHSFDLSCFGIGLFFAAFAVGMLGERDGPATLTLAPGAVTLRSGAERAVIPRAWVAGACDVEVGGGHALVLRLVGGGFLEICHHSEPLAALAEAVEALAIGDDEPAWQSPRLRLQDGEDAVEVRWSPRRTARLWLVVASWGLVVLFLALHRETRSVAALVAAALVLLVGIVAAGLHFRGRDHRVVIEAGILALGDRRIALPVAVDCTERLNVMGRQLGVRPRAGGEAPPPEAIALQVASASLVALDGLGPAGRAAACLAVTAAVRDRNVSGSDDVSSDGRP